MPCEWSTLYLEDAHSGKVLYQVLKGGRPSGPIIKVGDGAPGLVSQTHEAVILRNAQSDPRFTPGIYGDAASRVRARFGEIRLRHRAFLVRRARARRARVRGFCPTDHLRPSLSRR